MEKKVVMGVLNLSRAPQLGFVIWRGLDPV